MLANDAFLIPQEESLVNSDIYGVWGGRHIQAGDRRIAQINVSGKNMNMKIYCDPGAELFSSALMPTAILVSLPKAAQVSSLSAMVWSLAGDTRARLPASTYHLYSRNQDVV